MAYTTACIHAHPCVHVSVLVCMHVCACMCQHLCACVCVCLCLHVSMFMFLSMFMCSRVCMFVCPSLSVCVCCHSVSLQHHICLILFLIFQSHAVVMSSQGHATHTKSLRLPVDFREIAISLNGKMVIVFLFHCFLACCFAGTISCSQSRLIFREWKNGNDFSFPLLLG